MTLFCPARWPWFPGVWMGLVALLSLGCGPMGATDTATLPTLADTPEAQTAVLEALQPVTVVYLGETHDSAADHAAQLSIIQALCSESALTDSPFVGCALAFEMFQRPFQPVLDAYVNGEIDEATLVAETEYEQRWGFPWSFYAPIVQYGQAQQMPLIALNSPTEITRQVARDGLASLQGDDFRYIPPVDEIHTDNGDYRSYVQQVFESFHGGAAGHGSAMSFDNFFAAQVLWDETMADRIATYVAANPDHRVIVLVGQGHVIYDWGIPSRVERRLGDDLTQRTLLLNPPADLPDAEARGIADYLWVSGAGGD